MERAQGGDRKAFEELLRLHEERLQSFVASRLGANLRRKVTAEDVAQDTLLKAFQALGSFRWQGEDSFFRWLSSVAENVILYHARRDALNQKITLPRKTSSVESPSSGLVRAERFDRLRDALKSLPDEYQQVILLTRIEGLPVKEVAQRMGRSTTATSQLLWRALQKLKTAFGDTASFSLPERSLREQGELHEP